MDRGGARRELRLEVGRGGAGDSAEQVAQKFRLGGEQLPGAGDVAAGAAFDHVAGECPGRGGEADDGNVWTGGATDGANGVRDKFGFALGIEIAQAADGGGVSNGAGEHGAVIGDVERHAHGFGDDEDVREDDDGVHAEDAEGLEGYFGGEVRGFADFEEGVAGAEGLVFGKIAPGLAHDPDGYAVNRLEAAGAEKDVFAGWAVGGHRVDCRKEMIAERAGVDEGAGDEIATKWKVAQFVAIRRGSFVAGTGVTRIFVCTRVAIRI